MVYHVSLVHATCGDLERADTEHMNTENIFWHSCLTCLRLSMLDILSFLVLVQQIRSLGSTDAQRAVLDGPTAVGDSTARPFVVHSRCPRRTRLSLD